MGPFRTVLEQKIRERRMSFDEFVAYAETYAREHREPATLSVRHLQRLASGRRSDGRPLGTVRPETARLLEHILGLDIDQLLTPPAAVVSADDPAADLRRKLDVARRIDGSIVAEFQSQLAGIRRLDRQLGAIIAHDEVRTKIDQVANLLTHSVSGRAREQLAGLLSELYCLAGWQALDMGNAGMSWRHYDRANTSALESEDYAFKMLASAGRAFVLIDVGETALAVDVLSATCRTVDRTCSRLVRSWMSAARGEALAADGRQNESLRAFDQAATLLTTDVVGPEGPYVALDSVHLARWRGHALARCGMPTAIDVLSHALEQLAPTFTRAETALRVDLATALAAMDEPGEARTQINHARRLATQIGSSRQNARLIILASKM